MSFFDRIGVSIGYTSEPKNRHPAMPYGDEAGSDYRFQGQLATDRVYQDPKFVNVKKTLNVFKNAMPEHSKECECKECMAKKDMKKY